MTKSITDRYLDLIKHSLLDDIYNPEEYSGKSINSHAVENGTYWPKRAHTMIGLKRLNNIEYCIKQVIENNIEGDVIETGVWRGGATIFMNAVLKAYNQTNRKVYVADSFEGLPKPDPKYPVDAGDKHYTHNDFLGVSLEEVKRNFERYNLLDDNVVFIKGFFENSLKNAGISKLSVLRLDGDMYSSTIQVLDALYDKVSEGGYVIVDDYSLGGCRRAIDDYRKDRHITSPIVTIDWTGIYWKIE